MPRFRFYDSHRKGCPLSGPNQSPFSKTAVKILKQTMRCAACVVMLGWAVLTTAQAPHRGSPATGAPRPSVPRPSTARGIPATPQAMNRPQFVSGPHFMGAGLHRFGFGQRPINVVGRRVFIGAPLFRFRVGRRFYPTWLPSCVASLGWAWGWGLDCSGAPLYEYAWQPYLNQAVYESPMYFYGALQSDVVWLYMKNGQVRGATDYWFVNGELHFIGVAQDGRPTPEQVLSADDLDVNKTVYFNTRRGFRMVWRDEPWQQWLQHHPDDTPSELKADSSH